MVLPSVLALLRIGSLATALMLCLAAGAYAVEASAVLSGTVTNASLPVAGATVTAAGNNRTLSTKTDAGGRFYFPPLLVGTYMVRAESGGRTGAVNVDLADYGADVTVALTGALKVIASVSASTSAVQTLEGSGSDTVLNQTQLTRMPFGNSFTEMEIQMPGAVRGANGVVHLNGDHGIIDYTLDGVALPQELNRDIGGEINVNDLSFVDVIEGAYPAQYGLRFGSVFNMATRAGTGPSGFDATFSVGSYTGMQSTLGYHAPIAGGGGYDVAVSGERSTRGLDPPAFDSPHNDWSTLNQFLRVTLPHGGNDYTDVTFVHANDTFQIPNDTQFGEPAWTDDDEWQQDYFLAVQQHDAIGTTGLLTFGPAFKSGRIQDFGDPPGDFAYGEALNVTAPPFGNGAAASDCANAMSNPKTFLATTCAFSLADTRTAIDYIWQTDYTQQFGNHTFTTGGTYDGARILKDYRITLQPNNFLAPIVIEDIPGAPVTVVDDAPNAGNTYSAYAQDSWRLSPLWQADYGMRYDFFTIKSTGFFQGFGGVSPRLKLTRFIGKRAALYAYIGRFFEPFSLENVSPKAAQLLNLPLQPAQAQFDLKPERDTDLELGGHLPIAGGDLGFRVWQKNANNLIDDTQVGVTLLHQDINYVLGRLSQEAIDYVHPLARNSRFYFSGAHVISLNSGCETQLLAPCFGQHTGYTPADHEQRWTLESGVLMNDSHGGWFAMDGEYGSGLSSALCPPATPGYCKLTPHTIFNLEKGLAIGPKEALYVSVQNLLNDRYYVTILNAQGNHYAAPRLVNVGVRFSQ